MTNRDRHPFQRAMTLIEVTIVVAVILGLVTTGIIGANTYKQGTNRAFCIQNVARAQKAVRAYCNLQELIPGQAVPDLKGKIISAGFIESPPQCPAGGVYQFIEGVAPDIGELFMTCSIGDHRPNNTVGW